MDRRAFLSGTALVAASLPLSGVVALPAIAAPQDSAAWNKAMRACIAAKIAYERHNKIIDPLLKEEMRRFGHASNRHSNWPAHKRWRESVNYDALSATSDALCSEWARLELSLLNMPAPNLAALRWKMDLTFTSDGIEPWTEQVSRSIRADCQRLLPREA